MKQMPQKIFLNLIDLQRYYLRNEYLILNNGNKILILVFED
jgi:hypothetical protein